MKNRLDPVLIGRARRVLLVGVPAVGLAVAMVSVAPAQQAFAQESSGGSINIGGNIAATVASAVADIATHASGGTTTIGGSSVEHNEIQLGDDESVAISDASGGQHNVSDKSGSHNDE
jgi:hypothetical protein